MTVNQEYRKVYAGSIPAAPAMHICNEQKILDKLEEHSEGQLRQLIFQAELQLVQARKSCSNYTEENMRKYGTPYINRWQTFYDKLVGELHRRIGSS